MGKKTILLFGMIAIGVVLNCRSLDDHLSWPAIVHRIKTGDGKGGGAEIPITAELIKKLRVGIDTEQDVRRLFPGSEPGQWTFDPYLPVYLPEGVLRIERKLGWSYIPSSYNTYDIRGQEVESCSWTDRIYLGAFFKDGILQFYTVAHDHVNRYDRVVDGHLEELSMMSNHGDQLGCSWQLYEIQAYGLKDHLHHSTLYKCPWYEDLKKGKLTDFIPQIKHDQYCSDLH